MGLLSAKKNYLIPAYNMRNTQQNSVRIAHVAKTTS